MNSEPKNISSAASSGVLLRHRIQLAVFAITVAIGIQFAVYVHQASGDGEIDVARPPGVEGFLPIGALMGWKLLVAHGVWDKVHPAGMVILGFALLVSFTLRKAFCAWFCPVGTLSEGLWRCGRRIFGKNILLPRWADIPLRGLKYLLLGFFVWIIIVNMDSRAITGFFMSPYYKTADVRMLEFFTAPSLSTVIVMSLLLAGSLFVRNLWCRYLCPYGALTGLVAILSPSRIRRNPDTCIGCGQCARTCPHDLPVDRKQIIISPECSGCMDCTLVCPVPETLSLTAAGVKNARWSVGKMGFTVIGMFLILVYAASITGHWRSSVSEQEFRMRLKACQMSKQMPQPESPGEGIP